MAHTSRYPGRSWRYLIDRHGVLARVSALVGFKVRYLVQKFNVLI